MGHFNVQNVTKFDTVSVQLFHMLLVFMCSANLQSETQPVDLINASDEEMEAGEVKETK